MTNKRLLPCLLSVGCAMSFFVTNCEAKAITKTKKHKVRGISHCYFVPPPPPYAPSALPETYIRAVQTQVGAKTENPYGKYIYERTGSTIQVVQPNKYVSYWNRT